MNAQAVVLPMLDAKEGKFQEKHNPGEDAFVVTGNLTIEERWRLWFQSSHSFSEICPSAKSSCPSSAELDDSFYSALPESIRGTQKAAYLLQACTPTNDEILNRSQIGLLTAFGELLSSDEDARVLRRILRNAFFSTLDQNFQNLSLVGFKPSFYDS